MRIAVARSVRWRASSATVRGLRRRLSRAARRLGADPEEIDVRLVGSEEMGRLNAEHMGESGPTDVLSFPAPAGTELLGDIALNVDDAATEAALVDLAIHGLAHLLGHDHRSRAGARAMVRVEARACRAAGLPPPSRPYGGGR
jgi:probable rRNA maturation factor